MKKLNLLIIISLLILSGCMLTANKENTVEPKTYFYVGKSESWLATYSISEVNGYYYDSLYMQSLKTIDNDEKIGPIEYTLNTGDRETSSLYPRDLKGVGNFHSGSIINTEAFKIEFNSEVELTIKWQDKCETVKLHLTE